jgi:hypothetical protein
MADSEILIQLCATTMALFIGLLPITYMSWRDRFIESAAREARLMEGLGQWMIRTENKYVQFFGPFRLFNVENEIDITQLPLSIIKLDERLKKISKDTHLQQTGSFNPDSTILDGLNRTIASTLKRGYIYFISLLVLYCAILSSAVLLSATDLNLILLYQISFGQTLMIGLVLGSILYIVYAAVMFTDRQASWVVSPILKSDRTATLGMTSSLWRHQ